MTGEDEKDGTHLGLQTGKYGRRVDARHTLSEQCRMPQIQSQLLTQVFEFDLDAFDAGDVVVGLEAFSGFGEVLFFFAEEVERFAVVLEEVGADAVADACAAAGADVDFAG